MKNQMLSLFNRTRPFIGVIFMQVGFAGMDVLCKAALNKGMSPYVLVVYRHAAATIAMAPFAEDTTKDDTGNLNKATVAGIARASYRPELVLYRDEVYNGDICSCYVQYSSCHHLSNGLDHQVSTNFLQKHELENVNLKSIRSLAKVIGTLATVAGAMVMTLIKGPILELFWTKGAENHGHGSSGTTTHNSIKGALMITAGCFSWSFFIILQAITLKAYPAELSLTAWICFFGTVEGTLAALIMERGKASIWAIHWDTKLVASVYSGIICSGLTYYIQGIVMKDRGPVFVAAFSPLCMVIVAIMSTIILAEQMYLGRIIGAIIIIGGLYLVVWGKSKDHKSPSPSTDEHLPPAEQTNNTGSNGKENFGHEVTKIDV
ncbi:hypothetical protein CUMW_087510 [Citrus unshiu]|uniref:WAT1-related protein n=2 Tax=Citrus TaxID=2706 RepID=A0A2H5NYG9_CITUN|nr:hypothetical protein CUMW_087510 [Citrus unshiu]